MEKITEKEFIKAVKSMEGRQVEILLNGAIRVKKIIDKLKCFVKKNLIVLTETKTKEFVMIDMNEVYTTKLDKEQNIIQLSIDTMDEDTIITIKG